MPRKQGAFEDLLDFASRLNWRSAVALALISFAVFQFIVMETTPPPAGSHVDIVPFLQRSFIHFVALTLRFALPFGFAVGATVAYIKRSRAKRLYTQAHADAMSAVSAMSP